MILNHAIGRPHAVDSEWLIDFSARTTHSSSEHSTTFYTHLFLDPFLIFRGSSDTFFLFSTIKFLRLDTCLISRATLCLRKAADSVFGANSVFHLRSPGGQLDFIEYKYRSTIVADTVVSCEHDENVCSSVFLTERHDANLKRKRLFTDSYFLTSEHWSIS